MKYYRCQFMVPTATEMVSFRFIGSSTLQLMVASCTDVFHNCHFLHCQLMANLSKTLIRSSAVRFMYTIFSWNCAIDFCLSCSFDCSFTWEPHDWVFRYKYAQTIWSYIFKRNKDFGILKYFYFLSFCLT